MICPKYVEVGNKRYKINTDFRVAIRCNEIAEDENINDLERALGIICVLFGDEALDDYDNYEQLINLARKYLTCGKEIETHNEEPDMDFIQDMDYIEASFMSDYHMDISEEKMHWWKFYNLTSGLSNSELGNCCIFNNIRNLRNIDVSKIKDPKEKNRIIEAKKFFALKKKNQKLTSEQEKSILELQKILQKGSEKNV